MDRQVRLEKEYETNFYALDTETTGFEFNQPVQIAAVRFENGKPKQWYNRYFKAEV